MRLEKRRSGLSVLRTIACGVAVVAVLATGGFIAGWWGGPQPEHSAVLAKETEVAPTQPAAKAPEGPLSVSIESLSTPVPQGSSASISVKTTPGASCTVKATYGGANATDSGLIPKTADELGDIDWTWSVGESTPIGTWPVEVACTHNGQSAVAHDTIAVVANEPAVH